MADLFELSGAPVSEQRSRAQRNRHRKYLRAFWKGFQCSQGPPPVAYASMTPHVVIPDFDAPTDVMTSKLEHLYGKG